MKALRCCKINFLQIHRNPKYVVFLVLMVLQMWNLTADYGNYAKAIGYPHIAPWLLPGIVAFRQYYFFFLMTFLLLVCDAPFRNAQQQLVIQRVGKRNWIIGQLLFVLALSVGFTLLLWVLSWIFYFPMLEWTPSWGKVLRSSSVRQSAHFFAIPMSPDVMRNANGLEATLWSAGMQTMVCFFLGCTLLLFNLHGKGFVGFFLGTVFALMHYFLRSNLRMWRFPSWLTWFSPVSWIDRSMMGHSEKGLPPFTYGACMICLLCAVEVILAVCTIHKCDIVTKE